MAKVLRNKKGAYSFVSIFIWFFLILVAASLLAIQQPGYDPKNIKTAADKLTWDSSGNLTQKQASANDTVMFIVYSTVNYFGEASFRIAKDLMYWTANNHDKLQGINPKTIIFVVMLAVLAPVLYPLTLIFVIIYLLIKEYFQTRKEKKECQKHK